MSHEAKVIKYLKNQLYSPEGRSELEGISNNGINWFDRVEETIDVLVPRLTVLAENLVVDVPRKLNSSHDFIGHIETGNRKFSDVPGFLDWLEALKLSASHASEMIGQLESQQISAAVQRYISSDQGLGDIVFSNGASIYPDFILKSRGYRGLPLQSRSNPVDGPCLQGKTTARPSNVPDGLELKTNRGKRIRVDAHGAHSGLHLGVTWELNDGKVVIDGVWIGYIRICDHRESGRNVAVTTVKHSFGHECFTSLLEG